MISHCRAFQLYLRSIMVMITVMTLACGSCQPADSQRQNTMSPQHSHLSAAANTAPTPSPITKLDPAQAKVTLLKFTQHSLDGELAVSDPNPDNEPKPGNIGHENPAADISPAPNSAAPPTGSDLLTQVVEFPYLEIQFDGANFVKVMRCPEDYRQKFQQFVANTSYEGAFGSMSYETFWLSSAEFRVTGCVYMGTHVVREQIFDLAAPTGHWFYLLNPCVSKGFSLSEQEACSHRLVASEGLEFSSVTHENVREDAHQIHEVEAKALGLRDRLLRLSHEVSAELKYCEKSAAVDAHNESVDQGWNALVGAIAGAAVGFIMAPFLGAMGDKAIRHGINYGSAAFTDGKQPMERYLDHLDCSTAESLMAEYTKQHQKIAHLALEAKQLRDRLARHDARLQIRNRKIQTHYTNMANCNCLPGP